MARMNLQEVADTLVGYGADLAQGFIDEPHTMTEEDADALFRTLVLDDELEVGEARQAYSEALDRASEAEAASGGDPELDVADLQAQAADATVTAVSGLARTILRSLSPIELDTLRAAAGSSSTILAWRQTTLTRLRFLGLVAMESPSPSPTGAIVLRLLEAGALNG